MKKFLTLILMISILTSATACSASQSSDANSNKDSIGKETDVVLDGEITGEINVSCYDSTMYKTFLEEASKAFEAKYPGTKVNINSFSVAPDVKTSTSPDGKTMKMITNIQDTKAENDYINKVSTELMTGGGADVLAMDILPYYKYAEGGQIENLNVYIEADETFNKEDYRQNILDATSYNGGQYIFPMDFSFDILSYDKTLMNASGQNNLNPYEAYTFDQLIKSGESSIEELNKANSNSPVKMFSFAGGSEGKGTIFNQLLNQDYNEFVDIENKKANFTDGKFKDILEKSKEYEEKGYLNKSMQKGSVNLDSMKQNASHDYLYKIINQTMLLDAFNDNNNLKRYSVKVSSAGGMYSENDNLSGILKNDDDEVEFSFSQAYAINSNSTNKKTAWEFIKFLAGEEMQTSLNLMGCPINNYATEEKAKQLITGELFSSEDNNGSTELNEEQMEIFNNYINALNQYSSMLNTYNLHDSVIDEMVNSEVKYFFDGSRSAEEVAEALQSKVELYINE